jgi:hypothetical protein
MLPARTIELSGDRSAVGVLAPPDVTGDDAVAALGLPRPRGVIVLNGGTRELPADAREALRRRLAEGVARVAVEERITVVTGGTDAGIFALFGAALDDSRTAPCVGVVPAGLVECPPVWTEPVGTGHVEALEPHHSHFLLIAGNQWGVETDAMLALVGSLSAECGSVAVVAGGGPGARREVLLHTRAGRKTIVLAGSGRLADELSGVLSGDRPSDPEIAEIVAGGLLEVQRPTDPPSQLAELVRTGLGVSPASPR